MTYRTNHDDTSMPLINQCRVKIETEDKMSKEFKIKKRGESFMNTVLRKMLHIDV